mmetsp:Transcript_9095/g.19504  ORF Transcript_9095/g.19504 Transcript_9095/m.19504 type:complete len:675 (+) Transcript_9095:210-2234(+)
MADDAMAIDSDHDLPATAAAAPPPAQQQQQQRRASMTEDEQKERRASIQAIMKDQTLTPVERRKSIQQLMDGRRRSSTASLGGGGGGGGSGMAAAAAAAAAFYTSSSDSDDDSDSDAEMGGASSSMGSSMASAGGQQQQHPGGAIGSRFHRRSSLRNSFIDSVSQMNTGGARERLGSEGISAGGGTLTAAHQSGGASHSLLGRRDSTLSAASSVDAASGHHLGSAIGSSRKMEKRRPQCDHYDRKCTIISPCCGLAFGCRICHDDCPVLPPPIFCQVIGSGNDSGGGGAGGADGVIGSIVAPSTGGHDFDAGIGPSSSSVEGRRRINRSASMPSNFTEEETHHEIDRFAIREVICRVCYCRQSSKTNFCTNCGIQFGEYHCDICNLWMSAEEEPYHCSDCGFCRVGGRENFKHCHDCGMCIDSLLFDDHNCKTGKYMSNCPVCQEDLFSSRSASHEMPCGHAIHWHCFRELTSYDTRCPVCKKTAETHEQMAPTWQAMAMGIALQPVPPDLARVVTMTCIDCGEQDKDRRWHFLGVQCMKCSSFNTTVDVTQLVGKEAAAFLGDVDNAPPDGAHAAFSGASGNVGSASTAAAAAMSNETGGDQPTGSAAAMAAAAVAAAGGGEAMPSAAMGTISPGAVAAAALGNLPPGAMPPPNNSSGGDMDMDDLDGISRRS